MAVAGAYRDGTERITGVVAVEFGISASTAVALNRAAEARGVSIAEIARRLVEAAGTSDFLGSVLDDRKER